LEGGRSRSDSRTKSPSITVASRAAKIFEVPASRLLDADFGDLLEHELSDRDRYERVAAKIAGRTITPSGVVGMDEKRRASRSRAQRGVDKSDGR
jgi:hypothetical protein